MKIFTLCTLLCFMSCVNADEKYYYADHARTLRREAAEEMCKRHKFLHIFGLGGGMMREVELVSISFSCKRKLTEDEIRELLVEGTLLLQNKINDAQKLRPYLSHYPFTSKGIKVAIFTYPKELNQEELSYASMSRGYVNYYNDKNSPDRTISSESFEEALQKVNIEQIMQTKEKPSLFSRLKTLYKKSPNFLD